MEVAGDDGGLDVDVREEHVTFHTLPAPIGLCSVPLFPTRFQARALTRLTTGYGAMVLGSRGALLAPDFN